MLRRALGVRGLCFGCFAAEQGSVGTHRTRVTVKQAVAANTPVEDVSVLVSSHLTEYYEHTIPLTCRGG